MSRRFIASRAGAAAVALYTCLVFSLVAQLAQSEPRQNQDSKPAATGIARVSHSKSHHLHLAPRPGGTSAEHGTHIRGELDPQELKVTLLSQNGRKKWPVHTRLGWPPKGPSASSTIRWIVAIPPVLRESCCLSSGRSKWFKRPIKYYAI